MTWKDTERAPTAGDENWRYPATRRFLIVLPAAQGTAERNHTREWADAGQPSGDDQGLALARIRSEPIATNGRWRIVISPINPFQGAVGDPGPQQSAIVRDVLRAQQRLDFRRGHQKFQEAGRGLFVELSLAILCECVGMPERIVGVEAHKPVEQQVVVQLIDQHPFRADAVDRLQHLRFQLYSGLAEYFEPLLAALEFRRQLIATLVLAVALIFLGVDQLGLTQQRRHLRLQLRLCLEHPLVAHRFVLGGIRFHPGAIQRYVVQAHKFRLQAVA